MRVGWRKAAELLRGRRRRIREVFLQETAFRNSVIISRQTDTWKEGGREEGKTEGKEAKVGGTPQTQSRQAAEQDSGKAVHK